MHLLDLFEAPIGDIYTHGDFTQPGSLRGDDLSLTSPKRQDKIRRVLQNAPVLIDLHFVNLPDQINLNQHIQGSYPPKIGYLTPDQVSKQWLSITPRPDALNLVYLQNEGDDRIPLTPWIIAHRMSHALGHGEPAAFNQLYDQVFLGTLQQVADQYQKGHVTPKFVTLAKVFGTTNACRTGQIKPNRTGEWLHDSLAQMCVVGDIRFNPAPSTIEEDQAIFQTANLDAVNQLFTKLRNQLLSGFRAILNNGIGDILVF
jgi:hypothetical protein